MKRTTEQVKQAMEQQTKKPKDRPVKRQKGIRKGEPTADFIPCVIFGKAAEFAEKYFRQAMRISVSGRIQTGSYTNRDGHKVYTTEVIVEEQEFAESKRESQQGQQAPPKYDGDGFMNIPEGIDEELPFN